MTGAGGGAARVGVALLSLVLFYMIVVGGCELSGRGGPDGEVLVSTDRDWLWAGRNLVVGG